MKKLLLSIFTLSLSITSFAQVSDDCKTKTFKATSEANEHKDCALAIAEEVLTKNLVNTNVEYYAKLSSWTKKTTNYTIDIDADVLDFCKGKNEALSTIFVACLVKAALSNTVDLHKESINLLVEYIKKPENGVKITGAIKKLLSAHESGDFELYYR